VGLPALPTGRQAAGRPARRLGRADAQNDSKKNVQNNKRV